KQRQADFATEQPKRLPARGAERLYLKVKLWIELLERDDREADDDRQAEDELSDYHRARREAKVEGAERPVPQEQDREDKADDNRWKSEARGKLQARHRGREILRWQSRPRAAHPAPCWRTWR